MLSNLGHRVKDTIFQGLGGSESSSETGLNRPITEEDALQVRDSICQMFDSSLLYHAPLQQHSVQRHSMTTVTSGVWIPTIYCVNATHVTQHSSCNALIYKKCVQIIYQKCSQITGRAGFSLPSHSFDTIQEAPENIPKVGTHEIQGRCYAMHNLTELT